MKASNSSLTRSLMYLAATALSLLFAISMAGASILCSSQLLDDPMQASLGSEHSGDLEFKYSIQHPIPGQKASKNLIVYFHSAGQNQYRILNSSFSRVLREQWEDSDVGQPTILSISPSKYWLVGADRLNAFGKKESLAPETVLELIERIQQKHELSDFRRIGLGGSMGAFNLFNLMAHDLGFFDRVGLYALPTMKHRPHWSKGKDYQHWVYSGAFADPDQRVLTSAIRTLGLAAYSFLVSRAIKSEETWKRVNPYDIAKAWGQDENFSPQKRPKIYLSTGEFDGFGYFQGSLLTSIHLEEAKFDVTWEPVGAPHFGPYNLEAIGRFANP